MKWGGNDKFKKWNGDVMKWWLKRWGDYKVSNEMHSFVNLNVRNEIAR